MQCDSICFDCTSQKEFLSYEACGPRDLKSEMSAAPVFLGTENPFTLHVVVGCYTNWVQAFLFGTTAPPPPPLPAGQGHLTHEVSRSHTATHHSRYDSSGRVISSSQRSLPDNTQHSQQTDFHDPGGIRTHNLSRRSASDICLRLRGHWEQLVQT